jgi:small redox-active disulfide protein 2
VQIKVLGTGCAKCQQLETIVRQAVDEMGLDATVEKVTEFADIASFGVMSTPALVIDGQVRLAGRLPKPQEIVSILSRANG